jgi:hypothetical protein
MISTLETVLTKEPPMPDTFWSDLLVAVLGAVFTVVGAGVTYLIARAIAKTQALNGLIREMHHRRALKIREPVVIPGAQKMNDYKWANASILSLRDEIRRARDQVGAGKRLQEPLAEMTRACNRYLEQSNTEPTRYAILLDALQTQLAAEARKLARRPLVGYLEPGAGSY